MKVVFFKRTYLPALVFFLFCSTGNGQKPVLYFQQTNSSNGLSNNKVNCLLQDRRGFMWIGTNDGLNRYDGQHFTIFRNKPSDTGSISGNIITDLVEDNDGILWIATADGGITKYDYRLVVSKQFKQYKHNPGNKKSIPVNMVNCLLTNNTGSIWLGTSGAGVIKFNTQAETFLLPPFGNTNTFTDLCFDKKGIIWAGRQGGGYCKIDPVTNQYTVNKEYNNLYAKLPYMAINALLPDTGGVWIGSWDKAVYKVTDQQKDIKFVPGNTKGSFSEDEIISFAKDAKGNIYMGGKEKGLQYFDQSTNQFYQYQFNAARSGSLASNSIYCLLIDRSGILWVGTDKGVSRSNPLENQFVQTFLSEEPKKKATVIYDYYRYSNNQLWIATNEGIYIQQPNGDFHLQTLQYNNQVLEVTRFFKDPASGIFYLGTNYSLFRYDPVNLQLSLLPNTEKDIVMRKLIQSRIVSIEKDTINQHPVLVVLPYGHFLAVYDLIDQKWISRADTVKKIITKYGIKDNLIRKLSRNNKGGWYMATAKEGLANWEKPFDTEVQYYKNTPGNTSTLSSNNVYDFITDAKGDLWVSTFGGGLNYFNRPANRFFHIASSANLSEGLTTDAQGNIWSISNGHIYRYNRRDNSTGFFAMPDVNKSGGVRGLIYKDKDNHLFVSGEGYFIRFDPETVRSLPTETDIYFTDFKIFNTSYSHLLETKEIELSYRQSYFSFEFSVPSYSSSQPVEYFCKMSGEDKDWVSLGTRNFVAYNNLGGGSYTFEVRAVIPGSTQFKTASLQITVIPPFWKQWWFFVMVFVLAGLIIFMIYRYRINELLKRHAIRNKIAQDLHDSMGSTLSSISVYSQVAKIYQQQTRDVELNTILDKISETSTGMISDMNDIVWSLQPANDDMAKIIDRMESFAKPLCVAIDMRFDMVYEPAIRELNLPMEIRKNFYLLFKEAINNAVKYSGASLITVTISAAHGTLSMVITDNGKGFVLEENAAGGNGLKNMKKRAFEMNGSLTMHSSNGSRIILSIPIP